MKTQTFHLAVCVPDSCDEADVEILLNTFLEVQRGSNETSFARTFCAKAAPWKWQDTFMIIIIVVFILIVTSSTAYEYYSRFNRRQCDIQRKCSSEIHEDTNNEENILLKSVSPKSYNGGMDEVLRRKDKDSNSSSSGEDEYNNQNNGKKEMKEELLKSFSLMSNVQFLLKMDATPKGMESLNGIRVISMAWIIIAHGTNMRDRFSNNVLDLNPRLLKDFLFQFDAQAWLAVDTFIFLGGFLVAFGTFKVLERNKGRLNWALFYLNRYLRLTPAYMFVLLFYTSPIRHIISGPWEGYKEVQPFSAKCSEYWWTNVLYINNFIGPIGNFEKCMAWSWYLAVDMQFFLLSPIFLYAMYRNRTIGYVLVLLGITLNLLIVEILNHKYKFKDPNLPLDPDHFTEFFEILYKKPYTHIAPYLVGIACADIYMKTRDKVMELKTTWWKAFVLVMWKFAVGMNLTIVYGLYPFDGDFGAITPGWLNDLYQSTHRFVWSLTLAWTSYACLTGWGGFINSLLSLKIWEPLSRLCYLAYLINPIVIGLYYLNLKQTIYFNDWIFIYWFVSFLVIVFAASAVIFLLVEQPLARVQKLLIKK